MTDFHAKVIDVQKVLKAPKDRTNEFGGFNYRSAEHILTLLKPILAERELVIHLTDEMVQLGERYYVHAKAMISDGKDHVTASGWAREAHTKKGMDEAQVTGSASSYARKYALCGLLAIDDASQDPDANKPVDKNNVSIDYNMATELEELLAATETDREKFTEYWGVARLMEMNVSQYEKALLMLKAKKLKAAKNG